MHNSNKDNEKWDMMLQNVKSKGKKIKRRRKIISISSTALALLMIFSFSTSIFNSFESPAETLIADNSLEMEMLINSPADMIYDEDLGFIFLTN